MTPKQLQWLTDATGRIPGLLKAIEGGRDSATTLLGERVINGRTVRLILKVKVVGKGLNPLANHASVNFPIADMNIPKIAPIEPRRRQSKKAKRW